jgi:hypothetical protein
MGVSKLMDILGDSREVIRNDVSWDKFLQLSNWLQRLFQKLIIISILLSTSPVMDINSWLVFVELCDQHAMGDIPSQ